MRHSMRMLVKDTRSQDGIDDKDNDKGSKSRSQSMKEQAYNKEQRERPRPHELNDKSNLIDLMKELYVLIGILHVLTTPMAELLEDDIVEAIRRIAKSVMEQFNKLLRILGQYIQHSLKMDESISVSSVIDKLPPSWKDFKHSLKHGEDYLSLVKRGSHLRIEESLRAQESDKGKGKEVAGPSVNMMGNGGKNKNNKQNKGKKHGSRIITKDCHSGNKKNNASVGGSGKGSKDNPKTKVDAIAWWINSGATTHVCKDRCWFKTCEPMEDGYVLYIGDDHFAPVRGKGSVMAVIRFPDPKRKTLGEKGIDCIFVGYAEHSNAYRFYVIEPNDSVSINTIIKSRDAIFDENRFSLIPRPKDIILNLDKSQRDDHSNDVPNETLEPRKGCKPLGCKWIFKRKMKVDGTIDKFKARLVIQGFRQKEGIDYFDTYAPVAHITTIRLLLALAAIHNLVIHQMDVKTSFLNGDLEEEVYMKQPEGFVMPGNEHKVGKLVKSLYRLKQTPKQWHQKFDEVVLSSGFLLNQSDKYVYSKFDGSGKGVIICLYIDDMLIFGTDQNQVDKTKKFLSSKFSMKDMKEADVILDLIEKLMSNTCKHMDKLEYSRAIGGLMYAMMSTRPDIAYAVGRLSRFTSNPSRHHWHAITRVFKYLKGTMNYGLSYVEYPSVLECYSDASWINHVKYSSFTSGRVFLLGGGTISWASNKQTCITGSTIESEVVALAAVGKEVEWVRNLIHEIPIWPKLIAPISSRCDSAATLAKAYSQIYNGKSRHLGVRHSMIMELIMNGMISIEFVRSQHNLADHLMNGLARDLVIKSVIGMGLKSI
ncbi:zinc finger, CCHC-type containing protein [Tanacetum coccineum]